MGLIAKDSGGGTYTLAPEGTHVAICCQIIDLGTQHSAYYNKSYHKMLIGWELPDELEEDGKPILIWNRYTVSLNEKAALRQHLQSWRGRAFTQEELDGFDLKTIIGAACLLNIVHTRDGNNTWANVSGVMALPKGTPKPKMTRDPIVFDIENFDHTAFDTFGDNLKKTIMESPEYQASDHGTKANGVGAKHEPIPDDDIPF